MEEAAMAANSESSFNWSKGAGAAVWAATAVGASTIFDLGLLLVLLAAFLVICQSFTEEDAGECCNGGTGGRGQV